MVRRGARRKPTKTEEDPPDPHFVPITRPYPPMAVLTEDQVDEVHRLSLRILADIGLEFMAPQTWPILEEAGCAVDHDTGMVRFPPAAVDHYLSLAPAQFNMVARDPAKTVFFGGDNIVYGSASSAPNVLDADRGRRPGTGDTFQDLVKLNHLIPSSHVFCGHPVEPIDWPANTRHLDSVYNWLTLSDKVFRLYAIGETRAQDGLAMIEIGHGISREQLREAPRTYTVFNVNSPLKIDEPLLLGSMELAKNNQAVVVSPVAFSGAMSPITQGGSLIQHNAESIGVIAFLQMFAPGSPVFYGSLVTPVDMKSGAPAMGVPETITGTIAAGQMARRYNLPQRIMLGSTSNAVDAQAAYETLMSIWSGYLSGAHLVHHGHGWMEGGLTTGYEKTVLDADLIQMMAALEPTIDLSDAEEAIDAIASVGPGGHFLGSAHTMSRYQTAFHTPKLSDWRPYEFWEDAGSPDTAQRANALWKEMLANYQRPPIDPAIDNALQEYVAKRKLEIGDQEI